MRARMPIKNLSECEPECQLRTCQNASLRTQAQERKPMNASPRKKIRDFDVKVLRIEIRICKNGVLCLQAWENSDAGTQGPEDRL
jgi:hypothetical protein